MNDMYNYSNNINNNGNPTLPKKNNTGIIVAICLFSSKKNFNFSDTIFSTIVLAIGVPNLALVCPSNCNKSSGI